MYATTASRDRHECTLPRRDPSGLPKLAPNARWTKRVGRSLRKLMLMNPNHHKCKELFRNKAAILAERKRHSTGPHFFVIHPLSNLNSVLQFTFVLVWIYSLIVVPLARFMKPEENLAMQKVQLYMMSPIQIVLIILFFNTGFIDKVHNRIILEPKKIVCRYLFTFFMFDYLSTHFALPMLIKPFEKTVTSLRYRNYQLAAVFVRIICFSIRIPTLLTFIDYSLNNLKFKKTFRTIVLYILRTYLYLHLMTFVIIVLPVISSLDKLDMSPKSYVSKLTKSLALSSNTYRWYFEIFRMVSCYFFGVGYAFEMDTMGDQICAVIIALFGRLYTLFLMADILRIFGIAGVSQSMCERRLSLLQTYLADQDLPDNLRERILRFFRFKFQGRYFNEQKILNTLSENLRTELFLFSARKLIQKVEIFKKLPNSVIGEIIGVMKSETYSPRDVIITVGSEVRNIYFISSGTVAVLALDGTELCHLEDGDAFATTCLFLKEQIYAVVAAETTEVFIINKNEFIELLAPFPDVLNGFYRKAKARLVKLKGLLDNITKGKVDLISELRSGNILEKPAKRVVPVD